MNAATAIRLVISIEGGYVNDPGDPGGETKFGISKRAYPGLDIKKLTVSEAYDIYLRDYWAKYRIDDLPSKLQLPVFDCAVNCGGATAVGLLQLVLGIKADGVVGPITKSSAAKSPIAEILPAYLAERALYYSRLDTFTYYGRGWFRRLFKIALMA
jgi:lysozyme family protein